MVGKRVVGSAFGGKSPGLRRSIDWGSLAPLRIRARMVAEGVYAGAHRSARKGAGVEFGGHRAYTPGDDLRWLDVRSLLRHDHLLVRQFETETDRALRLVVDATASMGYRGSGAPASKIAWASLVAAALARVAIRSGDPVGLGFIGGAPQALGVPVSGGREAFERVVDALEGQSAEGDALADISPRSIARWARSRARRGAARSSWCSAISLDLAARGAGADRAPSRRAAASWSSCRRSIPTRRRSRSRRRSVSRRSKEGRRSRPTKPRAIVISPRSRSCRSRGGVRCIGRGASFLTMTTDHDPVAAVRTIIEAVR